MVKLGMTIDSKILLFEPEPVLRQRILKLLRENLAHAQCRAAENFDDIQGFLRTTMFDLLIVDFSQLGPEGLQHLRILRAQMPQLPILALGLMAEPPYEKATKLAGATRFLSKAKLQELPNEVTTMLGNDQAVSGD